MTDTVPDALSKMFCANYKEPNFAEVMCVIAAAPDNPWNEADDSRRPGLTLAAVAVAKMT